MTRAHSLKQLVKLQVNRLFDDELTDLNALIEEFVEERVFTRYTKKGYIVKIGAEQYRVSTKVSVTKIK